MPFRLSLIQNIWNIFSMVISSTPAHKVTCAHCITNCTFVAGRVKTTMKPDTLCSQPTMSILRYGNAFCKQSRFLSLKNSQSINKTVLMSRQNTFPPLFGMSSVYAIFLHSNSMREYVQCYAQMRLCVMKKYKSYYVYLNAIEI